MCTIYIPRAANVRAHVQTSFPVQWAVIVTGLKQPLTVPDRMNGAHASMVPTLSCHPQTKPYCRQSSQGIKPWLVRACSRTRDRKDIGDQGVINMCPWVCVGCMIPSPTGGWYHGDQGWGTVSRVVCNIRNSSSVPSWD